MRNQVLKLRLEPIVQTRWAKYAALALLVVLPWVIQNNYYIHVLNILGIYVILSVSLDLTVGTTGLLQLGHAGFYGFGAYVGALISTRLLPDNPLSFWIGLPVVILLTMSVGLFVGAPSLRLKGIYFALATLGFGEIMRSILLNWESVTQGPYGIKAIPAPQLGPINFGNSRLSFYLIWAFVLIAIWTVYSLRKSRFGRFWRAVREDEIGASTLGISTYSSKVWALMISAGIAGVAGSIFAHYVSYINPSNFVMDESILILSMVIIGGRDKLLGAIIGAGLLILIPEMLRFVALYRLLIYGLVLAVMVIYKPEGVMGKK